MEQKLLKSCPGRLAVVKVVYEVCSGQENQD